MTVFGGDIIYAADLNNLSQYVVKSANQPIASSTTYQTDSELVTPTLAIGTWHVELSMIATSATPVKVKWVNTGTMANNRRVSGAGSSVTDNADNSTGKWAVSGFGTDVVYGYRAATAQFHIEEWAMLNVTVAGTITVNWGQNASSGTNTTILAYSYWRLRQVA